MLTRVFVRFSILYRSLEYFHRVEDMGMANIKEDCELEYGLTLCFYLRPWPKKRSNWECLMKVETTLCSSIIRDVYCN